MNTITVSEVNYYEFEGEGMITPATEIRDRIFKLDIPIEELHPRQIMLLKREVLKVLTDWQREWDALTYGKSCKVIK